MEAEPTALNTNARPGLLTPRANLLLLGLGLALFVGVRLRGLTAACLWFDEIFSVHAARHGWTQILSFAAADLIHPPLFYVLLKIWIAIGGQSLMWVRLFPLVMSVAALVPFLLLGRELKLTAGEKNLALLLMASSGFLIKYAQEVRMYSLLFFFSLCSLWLFVKFLKRGGHAKRILVALTVTNALLVYTHYSGWVLLAVQCLATLIWERRRLLSFLASGAALLVTYLPWLFALYKAAEPGKGLAQNIGWVSRPGLREVAQSITTLNKPFSFSQSNTDTLSDPFNTTLVIFLVLLPLVVLGWQLFRATQNSKRDEIEGLRMLFLFAFAPAFFIFLLSWILPHSIWGTRHLIIAAGPYCILASCALMRLQPYWVRVTVFLLLACWLLLAGVFLLIRPAPKFIWCAWEPLAQEMVLTERESGQPVQVYAFEDLVAYHLWYGLDADRNSGFKVAVIKGAPGVTEDAAYFLPRRFGGIAVYDQSVPQGNDFWIAFRTSRGDETHALLDFFESRGYRRGPMLRRRAQGQEAFLVRMHHEK